MTYIMATLRGLASPEALLATVTLAEMPVVLTSDRPVSAAPVTAPAT